ncbi:DUF456 domain-containing protein [Ornithinibacillus sp. 4-3]|uniref:DUF456 domain-containing protein n=1 Tax=Ornithinibacillus sp. 4-3 TaxID=3231488 RepID=A0AB39HQ32_9BACI
MEALLWLLIILMFIISFVGLLFPIIPSSLFIWGGFLTYHFFINDTELNSLFWVIMALFTILLFVADILMNSYFVKRFGGSKWGERGAAIAVIVGSFVLPPFGIIILPFLTVFFIESFQQRGLQAALRSSIGSLFGFLGSTFAKMAVQFLMIIWFILLIIF